MKLISEIEIEHFRTFRLVRFGPLGDLTAFAGLNNSGKSNVLRALNAFFSGYTDPGSLLDVDADYCQQDLKSKQARKIRVGVTFDLPNNFTFRKDLGAVESLLGGRLFRLMKEWVRGSRDPAYYLNDGPALGADDRNKVDQFLALISFRYIPNRVLPLDIIRQEQQALRDVMIRRLGLKFKGQEAVFEAMRETSASVIKALEENLKRALTDVGQVRLATPDSWKDIVLAFGYKLGDGDIEVDDTLQGSGVQSLLMLETLALIDRDFFQKFGWRQAALWALEEPESSMHSRLEAYVAGYLAELASAPTSRLQIMSTTHSDLILQFADRPILVTNEGGISRIVADQSKSQVLETAARQGISRWVHPILANPLSPVVLVEGKFDFAFLDRGIKLLAPGAKALVTYLAELERQDDKGGIDSVLKYLQNNLRAIRARIPSAPIMVVLDWDVSPARRKEFEKLVESGTPYHVLQWPPSAFNPDLGPTFKGIERHMSTRIIDKANVGLNVVAQKPGGVRVVAPADYDGLKVRVHAVVEKGLSLTDLGHAREFILETVKATVGS